MPPFLSGFFGFSFGGWAGSKVILVKEPQTPQEIVKSAGTWGIPDGEAGKDSMKMVFFEASGPLSIGKDLEFNGKKDGTEHVGRKSGSRTENRISVLHEGV